jgi:hypothetical protein
MHQTSKPNIFGELNENLLAQMNTISAVVFLPFCSRGKTLKTVSAL